jgi:hypothetical protein
MSMGAWIYQKVDQVAKLGEDKASWYVGWYEPDGRRKGKSCGPGFHGKEKAMRLRRKIEAELMTGQYRNQLAKSWADFRTEYDQRILTGLAAKTRDEANVSLGHFERIVKPQKNVLRQHQRH